MLRGGERREEADCKQVDLMNMNMDDRVSSKKKRHRSREKVADEL